MTLVIYQLSIKQRRFSFELGPEIMFTSIELKIYIMYHEKNVLNSVNDVCKFRYIGIRKWS